MAASAGRKQSAPCRRLRDRRTHAAAFAEWSDAWLLLLAFASVRPSAALELVEDRIHVVSAARTLDDARVAFSAGSRALHVGEGALADGVPDRVALHFDEQVVRFVEHLHRALRDEA